MSTSDESGTAEEAVLSHRIPHDVGVLAGSGTWETAPCACACCGHIAWAWPARHALGDVSCVVVVAALRVVVSITPTPWDAGCGLHHTDSLGCGLWSASHRLLGMRVGPDVAAREASHGGDAETTSALSLAHLLPAPSLLSHALWLQILSFRGVWSVDVDSHLTHRTHDLSTCCFLWREIHSQSQRAA